MPSPSRPRYIANLLGFALLVIAVLIFLVLPTWIAWQQTRPLPRAVPDASRLESGLALETIAIRAADGVTLQGWYLPPRNGAVILLFPGYGSDRRGVIAYAKFLSEAGFGLLMMDPRATGESPGEVRSYGWADWADGTALVEALLQRPDAAGAKFGSFGCSTGAEIALGAAALEPRISAVVADAPYYAALQDISAPVTWRDWLTIPLYPVSINMMKLFSGAHPPMALVDAVAEIAPRPLLIIAGEESNGGYELRQAAHFYAHAGENAALWAVPQAGHCGGLKVQPVEYPQRVIAFFEAALLGKR